MTSKAEMGKSKVTTDRVKELRDQSGFGIMSCRNALIEAKGDTREALEILKQQSLLQVEKKADRPTTQGIIETYVHAGERIGAMIEVNCETDFVARTGDQNHSQRQFACTNVC